MKTKTFAALWRGVDFLALLESPRLSKDPRPVFLLLEEVGVSCLAWLYVSVSDVGVLVTQSQRRCEAL